MRRGCAAQASRHVWSGGGGASKPRHSVGNLQLFLSQQWLGHVGTSSPLCGFAVVSWPRDGSSQVGACGRKLSSWVVEWLSG